MKKVRKNFSWAYQREIVFLYIVAAHMSRPESKSIFPLYIYIIYIIIVYIYNILLYNNYINHVFI